jgi:hypothetical protein
VSCHVGLNGPTTGPDRAELNRSCRARPTGCRLGPSTARLVLRAGLDPLPVVPSRAHVGPNHAARELAHLSRAKFSGLREGERGRRLAFILGSAALGFSGISRTVKLGLVWQGETFQIQA